MASGKLAAGVAVAILVVSAVVVFATLRPGTTPGSSTGQTTSTSSQGPGLLKGLTFSPLTYDANGINDFFAKAGQSGSIVEWAGDWQDLGETGSPATVVQLAADHNLKSMIVVQFFTQSTGQLIRPLNTSNEAHYLSASVSFVSRYKPAYFGMGIEVNLLYEKNATAFAKFVSLYGEAYTQVKAASPATLVFTIFQLERMNGLGGGLYGGINDPSKSEWQILAQFPKDDIAAFTTYPSLVYHAPSEIPNDYYTGIASHTNKSVGFTELGWHSGNVTGGWGSDETTQAEFVTRFFSLSAPLNRAFVVWSFLYDQKTTMPFDTMGLFSLNGTAKQSWPRWLAS